jgi:hypothetical protein
MEAGAGQGRELEQREWAPFFDELNKRVEGGEELDATVEVVSEPLELTEAERLPLASITHEDGDHQIAIGLGGRGTRYPTVLWHYVDAPRRVVVSQPEEKTLGVSIESGDGSTTAVRLYEG